MRNKKECCGCTACQQICPVQCIAMVADEEGFLYPKVDESRCIGCKKCETVCPVGHPQNLKGNTEAYVGYAVNDSIRMVSSSGGVFSLLAESVLRQHGVVFGAAFDETFRVHHCSVESQAELYRLRGSKYVQSDLGHTYAEAKAYLNQGRLMLFSGTACQIAGLKAYLGKAYDNLLTVDVLCHGTPSPKIWRRYLDEQEKIYGAKVAAVQFRDKRSGWKTYSVVIAFQNGQEYAAPFPDDTFMNMFLSNIDLRPSCHHCPFKEFPRVSDITIGDSWGVDCYMPELDDDKGTSVIAVHTEAGNALFDAISQSLVVKKAELDRALPVTADSRKSVAVHPNRETYWAAVQGGKSWAELHQYTRKSFVQKVVGYVQSRWKMK